jgi:hypothetical protein
VREGDGCSDGGSVCVKREGMYLSVRRRELGSLMMWYGAGFWLGVGADV